LDILIPWSLNDYLDMNSVQQARLKAQLREHQAWHCRSQLPIYLEGLETLQREVDEDRIEIATLRAHQRKMHQAIEAIAVRISPSASELLGSLDERQVRRLQETLAEKQRQLQEKFVEPELPRQIRERAERMQERVAHWTGRRDAAQRQGILQWAHALGEQNRRWLDNRRHWQAALVEAVKRRHDADFPTRLAPLLQEPEAFWTEAYRRSVPQTEQATLELIRDLYAMASAAQRSHLSQRLQGLHDDLASLDCLDEARPSPSDRHQERPAPMRVHRIADCTGARHDPFFTDPRPSHETDHRSLPPLRLRDQRQRRGRQLRLHRDERRWRRGDARGRRAEQPVQQPAAAGRDARTGTPGRGGQGLPPGTLDHAGHRRRQRHSRNATELLSDLDAT